MVRRNYIFDTIRTVFQRYGYSPIETPAMENLKTLLGKYGQEGDKLIFKILNSGDFFAPIQKIINGLVESVELDKEQKKNLSHLGNVEHFIRKAETYKIISAITSFDIQEKLSEKALRYDLTVPFARYVVQHQNEITFPFKRYQMQPVWRADKPQKGRYREFYQCDADIIGSTSLLNEIELIQIIDSTFKKLKIHNYTIQLNNRKILSGIAEIIGEKDKIVDITVAIDKLDKIGIEEVNKELQTKGISDAAIDKLQPIINLKGNYREKISGLKAVLETSEIGIKGIEEVEFVFNALFQFSYIEKHLDFNISLARGLNYYTGAIMEVKANDVQIGSICGGGRYDDLTGVFGLNGVSGVGISFGIDRIFDVMNELNLFDKIDYTSQTTKLLFAHLGEQERNYCIPLAAKTRAAGINTEIYPDVTKKVVKQFEYANKKGIPYIIVIGSNEIATGEFELKDNSKSEKGKMKIEDIISKLK